MRRSLRIAAVAALGWLPSTAMAQVNIEKLRGDLKQRPVFVTFEGNVTGRIGNVESIALGASIFAGGTYRRHLLFAKGQADYGRFEHTTTVAKVFLHARHNYQLKDAFYTELFAQVQRDDFRDLRLRNVYGAGPRFELVNRDDLGVYLGTAYMFEYEALAVQPGAPDEEYTVAHRWSSYLSLALALDSRTKIIATTYIQPRFDRFADYRILNESSFSFDLGKRVSAKITLSLRYDSDPPTGVRPHDVEIKNGLALSF